MNNTCCPDYIKKSVFEAVATGMGQYLPELVDSDGTAETFSEYPLQKERVLQNTWM
jgi:hypothetical protein